MPEQGSRKSRREERLVRLDDDVAAVFTTDESVNDALRVLLRVREIAPVPRSPTPPRPLRPVGPPAARLPVGPAHRPVKPFLEPALPEDVPAIVALRNAAATALTTLHGTGHWSHPATEHGVARDMKTSIILVAKEGADAIATLRLATRKPWAIDVTSFTACARPVYLHDMAVAPALQRTGIGRRCVEDALASARDMQCGAIRLDAYDAAAGAGGFYAKCGFREVDRVVYRHVPLVYFERVL